MGWLELERMVYAECKEYERFKLVKVLDHKLATVISTARDTIDTRRYKTFDELVIHLESLWEIQRSRKEQPLQQSLPQKVQERAMGVLSAIWGIGEAALGAIYSRMPGMQP